MLLFFILLIAAAAASSHQPIDQASSLIQFRLQRHLCPVLVSVSSRHSHVYEAAAAKEEEEKEAGGKDDHLLKDGLPGQPSSSGVNFKQFAGNIAVDESKGRSLFYYFVESSSYSSSINPLILWLNGGPGCSSLGVGALTEIGPFGVNPDGKTLYSRQFAWNKVANVLFLESPAGVGFSYSNTTSDYDITGDQSTAEDTYVFLKKWFGRYPSFKGRDFYLMGESYAGYYIPELADIILANRDSSTPMINLQGIMIGNGLLDDRSDTRGMIDFAWGHALVSDQMREHYLRSCTHSLFQNLVCGKVMEAFIKEIGPINHFKIDEPLCQPSNPTTTTPSGHRDPCDLLYVQSYLNLPNVQAALNANTTRLPHPWSPCSYVLPHQWHDSPSSMFPVYKRLMAFNLSILLYSGDMDMVVPFTGSRYALAALGIKVIKPWHWWTINETSQVTGYKVVYDGLTYVTIRGAGHEVSRSHPHVLYALLNNFLVS